jgi:VWFA-related protein
MRNDNMRLMNRVLAAATVIGAALHLVAGPAPQPRQDALRVSVDLVNVQFAVTDRRGRLVPGLTRDDFGIEEDGRKQDVRHFAGENELPLTLAMLIDTSPSVRSVFEEEKVTATAFLERVLRREDLALVIGFDRSVTLVQDFTENTRLLKAGIDDLQLGGGTSLIARPDAKQSF